MNQRIEVCQGPDCFGSGGGAVLLELEELVQEHSASTQIVRGGCRNFCAMGPNVHCGTHHFTKVTSPTECRVVVGTVFGGATEDVVVPPITTKLLLKRADRERWQCLRDMARFRVKRNARSSMELDTRLAALAESELHATRAIPNLKERAQRRGTRLNEALREIVKDKEDESSDEEDSDSDG
jgi:hypothetical protein